jgi:hypothetical protein
MRSGMVSFSIRIPLQEPIRNPLQIFVLQENVEVESAISGWLDGPSLGEVSSTIA